MERETIVYPEDFKITPGTMVSVIVEDLHAGIKPSETDYHEAAHAVAAGGNDVIEVTNVAGEGYLGRTLLTRFKAIAFAAAHALGYKGTGHDLAVLRRMGHDPEAVASDARRELAGREGDIHAVACDLAINRKLSGFGVNWAIEKSRNLKAKVEMQDPLGNISSFVTRVRKTIFGYTLSNGLPPPPKPLPMPV